MPIHPTALIDPQAEIDPAAEIGPYVVVEGPVRIGPATWVGPFVLLKGHTEVGSGCRIFSNSVIGELPQDRGYSGGVSFCRIGDETVIREGVTIHRGTLAGSTTRVGSQCFLMANSHVGHNCVVEDGVNMANGSLLAGHVHLGARVFLSGNSAVHQFVRIGELAMIGGLTKITQDVPPFFMADDRGTCLGINSVGMKRAGYTSADRIEARRIYRLLYRSGLGLRQALEVISETVETEVGRRLLAFLQAESRRGLSAGPRLAPEDAAPPEAAVDRAA